MLKKDNSHVITVDNAYGEKLTISIPWDSSLEDYVKAFNTILIWQTFSPKTASKIFSKEYRDTIN